MRVSKDEFLAINKAAVPVLKHHEGDEIWLVSVNCWEKIMFCLNLQQDRENALDNISKFLQTLSQLTKKTDNSLAK